MCLCSTEEGAKRGVLVIGLQMNAHTVQGTSSPVDVHPQTPEVNPENAVLVIGPLVSIHMVQECKTLGELTLR